MIEKQPPAALIISLLLFTSYVLTRLVWGQDGEIYTRSTSVYSALALTMVEIIYLMFFVADAAQSNKRSHAVSSMLLAAAVSLFIALNWTSELISHATAITVAAFSAVLVVIGTLLWWSTRRRLLSE